MKTHVEKRLNRIACGLLLLATGTGCTVREERGVCPCYLDVDYGEVLSSPLQDDPARKVEVALYDSLFRWTATHSLDDCPGVEEVTVEKRAIRVTAVVHDHPWMKYLADGQRIIYEPGNEMDALYVHSEEVDCSGEVARCLLTPHKQFSTLTFTDDQGGALCRRYNMVIRGTTCGFDATDLSAIEGPYLYTIQEDDGAGNISVRIPRQVRGDLLLEFWEKEEHRLLFSCPIGLYLFAEGYDPAARDLADYALTIDFRNAVLYLRVAGWEEEQIHELYD